MAMVVSTRTPATTRARSDNSSPRDPQAVADAAYRVDQGGLDTVELLAEVGDVRLHHIGVAAEVVLPDVVEDLRLGEHPVGVEHQVAQELELGGRQLHQGAVA